ncbi:MAG: hypothetical protein HW416_835 [Chloroflexi bacterium]|nr:hypothetical protein [Chloroflexota bacterium]
MGLLARLLISLVAVLSACAAPATPQPRSDAPTTTASGRPSTVIIAIKGEIADVAAKVGGGDTFSGEYNFLSSSPLAVHDGKATPHPLIAEALPSRDAGTWTVNADGTMATTWRLRPNAKWHDGRPVTPEDFAFTLRVYASEELPIATREPELFMDRIEGLDDRTFVIHWKQTYPWANELIKGQLDPLLARHVMESAFDTMDAQSFLRQEFWMRNSWIGTGPYRVVQWDLGNQMVFRAFDDYFLGRPKLDEVVIRVIEDTNTVVANLLSGSVDVSVGVTLGQIAGATIRDRWKETGEGQVVVTPVRLRFFEFQHDTTYNRQSALLDLRVRQAFAYGIDRASIAEVVSAGTSPVAHVFLSPTDALYDRAITRAATYPHDPSRALALLGEAGWTRRGDTLTNAADEGLVVEVRTTGGTDNETEATVLISDLVKLGVNATLNVMSGAVQADDQYRATFPGLNATARSIRVPETMGIWSSRQCPDQRFRGGNRGCWRNAEFDRLFTIASTSLDASERADAVAAALRILTQDVAVLPMSYFSENIAFRKGLVGPGPRSPEQVGNTWNIHEWHWAS